jgi:hypothetical protein
MKMQLTAKPPACNHKAFDDEHDNDHPSWRRVLEDERDDGHRHQGDSAKAPGSHTRDSDAPDCCAPEADRAPQSEHQLPAYSDHKEGLTVTISGSAFAAGEWTSVTGYVENFAKDWGDYSIAMGEAVFEAEAHSCEPDRAVAAVDTFYDVSGADFIFAHEIEQSIQSLYEASVRAELAYLAIDIEGWSPRQGPIVMEMDQSLDGYLPCDQPCEQETPFGNLAHVMATAEAYGTNALSATLTNSFALENQFSFVHATGLVAV